tara:strand:+ start:90 stop:692 length:603 start_codon:yes stop_codon:yes gene_type:complete
MKYISQFFLNLYYLFVTFFELEDFHVCRVEIDYRADDVVLLDTDIPDEWRDEAQHWEGMDNWYYMNITDQFKKTNGQYLRDLLDTIPDAVTDYVYTIKYMYGNKKYRYVSKSATCEWPPEFSSEMKFIPPIVGAWTALKGKQLRDITKIIRKTMGPKGDFHGQDVKIRDIVKYDSPQIVITTAMGSNEYSENDSVLDLFV